MRPATLALALGLPALTVGLAVAGAALRAERAAESEAVDEAVAGPETVVQKSLPVIEDRSTRLVAAGGIAPPDLGDAPIERVEPRAPLGELGLAAPPRPKEEGPLLFRPVAVESAIVEAGGRRVAVAGTVSVPPDRVCGAGEAAWPCGASARTAFRLWLRGRALECDLPKEAARDEAGDIVASCRLGGQDAGRWLVSNGWALAAPDGPYDEAERAARAAGKGIFAKPPGGAASAGVTPPADPPAPSR